MIPDEPLLVILVRLVDHIPTPPPPKRKRGHPKVYSDRVFLKALIIMMVKHLHKVHELLSVLEQPTAEMQTLRSLLTEGKRFPSRRTWERRLKTIPQALPGQIACFGCHLVSLIEPWAVHGRAVAVDSTVLRAMGGVWHKKDREQGVVPHTSIDTEAHWTKSGWQKGMGKALTAAADRVFDLEGGVRVALCHGKRRVAGGVSRLPGLKIVS